MPETLSKLKKIGLAVFVLFFICISVSLAVYLIKQRQEIRKMATGIGACEDGPGGCCNPNDPYQPQCGCREWEECAVDNGACSTGKSCRVKECLGSGASCSENWQCCSGYCINGVCGGGRTCNSCADLSYQNDPTCTADPNCTAPGQEGFCCKKPDGTPVCCYRNCECFEGQQGNCENRGNGRIWLKGGITVSRIYKMVGTGVNCPFSSSNQITIKTNYTVPSGGEEFSLDSDECGQIEAVGYCGSCKPGCFPSSTSTPPPEASCRWIKVYGSNWQELTPSQLSNLHSSDRVYFVVSGSGFDKARFRINGGSWQETTTKKPETEDFYISYIIPSGVTNFNIEAEVHHPTLGWR